MTMPEERTHQKFEDQNFNALFLTNGAFIGCYIILAILKINFLSYLKKLVNKCSGNLYLKHLVKRLKWNFVIRYVLVSTLQLAFAIALQFTNFIFESILEIISMVLAGLMMIFIIFFACWMIRMTSSRKFKYNKNRFIEKFGSLSDEYDNARSRESFIVRNFTFIMFIRKVSFVSMIVLGYQSCISILIFLLIQSLFMLKLLITELPYDRDAFNIKTIFQEILFSSLNIILMMIEADIISDADRPIIAGWVMIGLCIIIIIFNLFFVVKDQLLAFKNVFVKLKNLIYTVKQKKSFSNKASQFDSLEDSSFNFEDTESTSIFNKIPVINLDTISDNSALKTYQKANEITFRKIQIEHRALEMVNNS